MYYVKQRSGYASDTQSLALKKTIPDGEMAQRLPLQQMGMLVEIPLAETQDKSHLETRTNQEILNMSQTTPDNTPQRPLAIVTGKNYASRLGMVRAAGMAGCDVVVVQTQLKWMKTYMSVKYRV